MSDPVQRAARHRLVGVLLERYGRYAQSGGDMSYAARLNSLRLAVAAIAKLDLAERSPQYPLQIAVLGPTQAGKSSLVNVVLDADYAGISPLAGFTVHADGFAVGCPPTMLDELEPALLPLRRIRAEATTGRSATDAFDTYRLEPVTAGCNALIEHGIIWDSPDFDSIEAGRYRQAVLQAAGIADVLILVASKEKYADQRVWQMIALLEPLAQPGFFVLNKLDAADRHAVLDSFHRHCREQLGKSPFDGSPPPVVVLPAVANDRDSRPGLPAESLDALRSALDRAIRTVDRSVQASAVERFIDRHWSDWLEPVEQELSAAAEWQHRITEAIAAAEAEYQEHYLDNPEAYDTFKRALAELLTLLELPGIAKTLARTREIVTWPARKLLGVGRLAVPGSARSETVDTELAAIETAVERLLNRLSADVSERAGDESEWWRELAGKLQRHRDTLTADAAAAATEHKRTFAPRIEAAARSLYQQLERQPRLLNTLRATRVTTDAAGIALAVKSGGLAAADLVLAPAMLSVTTLLTESALGRYLDRIQRELKRDQLRSMRRGVLDETLGAELKALTEPDTERMRLLDRELREALQAAGALGATVGGRA